MEQTGVLVVRVWFEAGNGGAFRARVTRTLDVDGHAQEPVALGSSDEVVELVTEWLDAFSAAMGTGDAPVTAG